MFECGLYWSSEGNPCCVRVSFRHDQVQRACLMGPTLLCMDVHNHLFLVGGSTERWKQPLCVIAISLIFSPVVGDRLPRNSHYLGKSQGLGICYLIPNMPVSYWRQWNGKEDASQTCHYSHQCPAPSRKMCLTHNILLLGGRPPT